MIWCWLGFHKWEKWRTFRINYIDTGGNGIGQRRKCNRCGIIKERTVG